MIIILALDLSLTRTGYATPEGGCGVLVPPRNCSDGVRRLQWFRDRTRDLARITRAQLVVIEGYAFGQARGTSQLHSAGELGGVVRLALFDAGIPFVDVPPASLKKFATGKGNAPKELILVETVKRLAYQGSDHNECDALWLRLMALRRYDPLECIGMPAKNLEALAGVKWPELPHIPQSVNTHTHAHTA
ncbi:MAG: hypothetical protein ACRENP_20600 [Longimicrobiales bacterium]